MVDGVSFSLQRAPTAYHEAGGGSFPEIDSDVEIRNSQTKTPRPKPLKKNRKTETAFIPN